MSQPEDYRRLPNPAWSLLDGPERAAISQLLSKARERAMRARNPERSLLERDERQDEADTVHRAMVEALRVAYGDLPE